MAIRIGGLLLAVMAFATSAAHAAGCRLTEWNVDRVVAVSDAGLLEYRLERRHPRWHVEPFGHHADGVMSCDPCEPGAIAGGMVWFETSNGTIAHTSVDDDRAFASFQGAMWFGHGVDAPLQDTGDHLVTNWGPLQLSARRFAYRPKGKRPVDVIAASASDGCVRVRLYLSRDAMKDGSLIVHLIPWLEQIVVRQSKR